MWRTRNIPLVRPFVGRFSLGDGVSYVSDLPQKEQGTPLKNFMAVELSLGMRSHPGIELIARVHHRCSAWGAVGSGGGSNAVGLGLRALF
jgi:hypothetical protein